MPDGFIGQLFKTLGRHIPSAAGVTNEYLKRPSPGVLPLAYKRAATPSARWSRIRVAGQIP